MSNQDQGSMISLSDWQDTKERNLPAMPTGGKHAFGM